MEFYDCGLRSLQNTNSMLNWKFFKNGAVQMPTLGTGIVVQLISTKIMCCTFLKF